METRGRAQDGNGDGSGDENESSGGHGNGNEDGNGNRNGNGNEDGIGEGGREAKSCKKMHESCRRHVGNGGHKMTRMAWPGCAVMCNIINTHTHTHTPWVESRENVDKKGLIQ